MNFALPGIFVFLHIDSIDNPDLPVRLSTATLSLPPDHTEDGQTVPDGGVTELRVLRPLLPADLPGPGLLPPGEHKAVALDIVPVCWALSSWCRAGAETREVPGVGRLCPHQHQKGWEERQQHRN